MPGAADEAVRDLMRAREDAVRECRNARHRLKALLLRNGITYAGKSSWTAAHLRWLATLKLEHAAQQIGFQEYLHAITEATARIERLEQALRDTLPEWSLKPLVQALQAMRGVQLIAAMTLVAELQDFLRFDSARQLMAYVGLVPGEHSSGPKRRQGSITKAGLDSNARKQHGRASSGIRSSLLGLLSEGGDLSPVCLESRRCELIKHDDRVVDAILIRKARTGEGNNCRDGCRVAAPTLNELLRSRLAYPRLSREQVLEQRLETLINGCLRCVLDALVFVCLCDRAR